jgi:hypothetical protein
MNTNDLSITTEPGFDWAAAANQLNVIPNRQGELFSFIEDGTDQLDFSRRSGAFDWHTDGLYHQRPPRYVTQYCLHPGELNIKTALADSAVILSKMLDKHLAVLTQLCIEYVGHGLKRQQPVINSEGGLFLGVGFKCSTDYTNIMACSDRYVSTRDIANALSNLYETLDQNKILVAWEPDKLLRLNQYRYLHCRDSVCEHDTRKFVRIWSE